MTDPYETVEVHTEDFVTTVRLNRPESLNALDFTMADELLEVLRRAADDDDTRAVVLTGAGRGFCAGADLGDLAARAAAGDGPIGPAQTRDMMQQSVRLAQALVTFDKPLVAAVNGPCAGAGIGFAFAADVLLASEDATFSVAFIRRGLVPDYGVSFLLPRLVGLRAARELCLLGDRLGAAEVERLGLVTKVVAPDQLAAEARQFAQRLASGAGVALRLTKRMLADSFDTSLAASLDREFTFQAICFASEDAREGMTAFLEKREPTFAWR